VIRGTVKVWDDDEGCGVLVSSDAPGEVWAHFSHIEGEGFRALHAGDSVLFDHIAGPGGHDGYDYRATRVVLQRAIDA
jgi:cold shock protein